MGLACCIVEFDPNINADPEPILVVEGTITDGETVIMLNWSRRLRSADYTPEDNRDPVPVVGARVWVESEAGESFQGIEKLVEEQYFDQFGRLQTRVVSTNGHHVATGTLDDNTRYRVRIEHLDDEYVSEWRSPVATPPVEQMELHAEDGKVQVRVDVTGEPGGARHYLWTYEETWEIQAEINASHYYGRWEGDYDRDMSSVYSVWDATEGPFNEIINQHSYPGYVSPFFYCWKRDRSNRVLIADTKRVSLNYLRDHVLFEFDNFDDRLSFLYHLKLNQYAIGEDAFQYLNNLKENTDNTGSIFSPIPSEMIGNLVCTTSPETHVIGFVEASHGVVTERFFNSGETPYRPLPRDCVVVNWKELVALGVSDDPDEPPGRGHFSEYFLVMGSPDGPVPEVGSTYTSLRCIDCRASGGSKDRPDWWPNDHY